MTESKRNREPNRQERVEKLRATAKENVALGHVQFHLDEDTTRRLMAMADMKKMPLAVLARQWVEERLRAEEREHRQHLLSSSHDI